MARVVGKSAAVIKRVTCNRCSSILEYLPIEIMVKVETDYCGGKDIIRYIRCPCCNSDVRLAVNQQAVPFPIFRSGSDESLSG